MSKKHKYKQIERDMSDYIFANPATNRATVLRHFATLCDTPEPTVKRWYYNAIQIAKERSNLHNKIKDEVLVEETKKAAKSQIMTREALLEFYTNEIKEYLDIKTGKGKAKMIGNKVLMPTFKDAKEAGAEIAKIQGYYAPEKQANTTVSGLDVESVIKVTLNL